MNSRTTRSAGRGKRLGDCTLSLLLAAFALSLFQWDLLAGDVLPLQEMLQLDRSRPLESWRWLGGHWTHWSIDQLFWDTVMFLVLGAALEASSRWRFVVCVATSAVAISGFVLLNEPAGFVYRGLSGIDSALFVAFVITKIRERSAARWFFAGGLCAFAAKTYLEHVTGQPIFADGGGFELYVPAHSIGACVGLFVGLAGRVGPRVSERVSRVGAPASAGILTKARAAVR